MSNTTRAVRNARTIDQILKLKYFMFTGQPYDRFMAIRCITPLLVLSLTASLFCISFISLMYDFSAFRFFLNTNVVEYSFNSLQHLCVILVHHRRQTILEQKGTMKIDLASMAYIRQYMCFIYPNNVISAGVLWTCRFIYSSRSVYFKDWGKLTF